MRETETLLFKTPGTALATLAEGLGGSVVDLPDARAEDTFEAWREAASDGPSSDRVVVAMWLEDAVPVELSGVDVVRWRRRFEGPWFLWHFALAAAARRCLDGGSIVAVAQAPAMLDAAGYTPETSIAHGVLALVRSLAVAEGTRGVRVNLVTTPIGLVEGELIAPPPPLPGHPHDLTAVAGVVKLLLDPAASTLTGRVLPADGGRTL